jgi:hypothetical protein
MTPWNPIGGYQRYGGIYTVAVFGYLCIRNYEPVTWRYRSGESPALCEHKVLCYLHQQYQHGEHANMWYVKGSCSAWLVQDFENSDDDNYKKYELYFDFVKVILFVVQEQMRWPTVNDVIL